MAPVRKAHRFSPVPASGEYIRVSAGIREGDPAGGPGLLEADLLFPVRARSTGDMPDNLLEEPGRGDDRERPRRSGECRLELSSIKQPESQVDRGGRHPVLV